MSRCEQRARKRRARRAEIRTEFQSELRTLLKQIEKVASSSDRIATMDRIGKLLNRIAASDVPVWPFVQELFPDIPNTKCAIEDREEVLAFVAQVVAPHLAGMTSDSVESRYARSK